MGVGGRGIRRGRVLFERGGWRLQTKKPVQFSSTVKTEKKMQYFSLESKNLIN